MRILRDCTSLSLQETNPLLVSLSVWKTLEVKGTRFDGVNQRSKYIFETYSIDHACGH